MKDAEILVELKGTQDEARAFGLLARIVFAGDWRHNFPGDELEAFAVLDHYQRALNAAFAGDWTMVRHHLGDQYWSDADERVKCAFALVEALCGRLARSHFVKGGQLDLATLSTLGLVGGTTAKDMGWDADGKTPIRADELEDE